MKHFIATVHVGGDSFEHSVDAVSYKDAGNYAWGTFPDADDIEIEEYEPSR